MTSFPFLLSRLFVPLILFGTLMVARAAPKAPTNCVAAGIGSVTTGVRIGISWKDASNDESHWFLQISTNNGLSYTTLGSAIPSSNSGGTGGTVSALWTSGAIGQNYLFRVLAYNGQYSNASNIASVTATAFPLTASLVPNQVTVGLSWPAVANASSFRVFGAVNPQGPYTLIKTLEGNVTSTTVSAPTISAGNYYYFAVSPYLDIQYLGDSVPAGIAMNVITSKTGTSGTPGSPFSHTFTQTTFNSVVSVGLTHNGQTNLPAGLSFNSNTRVLSGVHPALGNYTLVYTANLSSGTQLVQNFSIRVRPAAGAPLAGTPIPDWTGAAGETRDSALAGTFTDPEAESAVRVSTTLGDMDFILFDSATPATVANFMNYVNAGKYEDVAFHRSSSNFVVQGGGFKGTGAGSNFTSVVTDPPVVNEPGIANVRGTVSMAKVAGNADSATSQFFVSTADNRANLDYQNAGFTVFGRVAGNGMVVADAINDLPTKTYNLYIDGDPVPYSFSDFPMNAANAPSSMDQTKLVEIQSVTGIPTISFSITGNTNPSAAAASLVAGQLHLEGLAGGRTTVTVTATDLDNLTNSQDVEVEISDTFGTWASRNTFPGGEDEPGLDPDRDTVTNLQEYAFFGDPAAADAGALPSQGIDGDLPAAQFVTLTFPVRKFTTGLSYVVEGNDSLSGSWTPVWSTADGFEHAQVVAADEQADRTVVTIKDSVPLGGQPLRFLRTRVVQE